MKKITRIILTFIVLILMSACVFKPSDVTGEQAENIDEKPDVYKKGYYKDCRQYTQMGVTSLNPNRESFISMSQAIIAKEDGFLIVLNNAVYRYDEQNSELIFKSEEGVSSLISVSDKYIFYLAENKELEEYLYAYNSVWSYNFLTGETKRVFKNIEFKDGRVVEYNNCIFATNDKNLYIYNSEKDTELVIASIYEKSEEEITNQLPDGFVARMIYSSYSGKSEIEIFYTADDTNERVGLAQNVINDSLAEIRKMTSDRFGTGWNWYKNLYIFYTLSEIDPSYELPQGFMGTEERCDTDCWIADGIAYIKGDEVLTEGLVNPYNVNRIELYEDRTDRIIGFNPDTNEVYLYIFEDNTITSKNLDSQEKKIIETLEKADTIKFYWRDCNLYWIYADNQVERFGGVHEFE